MRSLYLILFLSKVFVPSSLNSAKAETPDRPSGVEFHSDTLRRVGAHGDNWCIAWAADDSQIVSMDDGNWLEAPKSFSNRLYRLLGGPNDLQREDIPGYPEFLFNAAGWFGYGIASIDGTLYSFVSKCPKNHWSGPFRGVKLLESSDNGATWSRVNAEGEERPLAPQDEARYEASREEMFFFEEEGRENHGGVAYPFSFCAFAQRGRDHGAAEDGYAYIYSPEGASSQELLLARVPKDRVGIKGDWEFYSGMEGDRHTWSSSLGDRRPVHVFPEESANRDAFGWYSWLPSVVWNAPLGLYIMVNGGTYGGKGLSGDKEDYYSAWMHTRSGSLGFWYAEKPWGPWKQFFYTEEWTVDHPHNRTYQPKLSPKWIGEDGKRMVLIWSDAMKNEKGRSHTVNYKWNQMEISIEMGETK